MGDVEDEWGIIELFGGLFGRDGLGVVGQEEVVVRSCANEALLGLGELCGVRK